jgi:hypothetical protein
MEFAKSLETYGLVNKTLAEDRVTNKKGRQRKTR